MFNTSEYLKACLARFETNVQAHNQKHFNLPVFQSVFKLAFSGHKIAEMNKSVRGDFKAIYDAFQRVTGWNSAQAFLGYLVNEDKPYEDEALTMGPFLQERLLLRDIYAAYQNSRRICHLYMTPHYLEKVGTKAIVEALLTGVCLRLEEQLKEYPDLRALLQAVKKGEAIDIKKIEALVSAKLSLPELLEPNRRYLENCRRVCEYWQQPKMDEGFIELASSYLQPGEIKSCTMAELTSLSQFITGLSQVSYRSQQVLGGLEAKPEAVSHSPGHH